MTAAELIAKLRELDPSERVMVADPACGCCRGADEEGVLVRWTDEHGTGVALMHPNEVRKQR